MSDPKMVKEKHATDHPVRHGRVRGARWAVQASFLALFVGISIAASHAPPDGPTTNFLLRLDPLAAVVSLATVGLDAFAMFWPAWALLALTALSSRFFCGWLCPLGTCFDAAGAAKPKALRYYLPRGDDLVKLRKGARGEEGRDGRAPRAGRVSLLKYVLLALVLILAFSGTNLLYAGSPMVVMNRSVHQLMLPAAPLGLIALVLLAFLYRPRFYCESICPMGALMSLVSAVGKRLPSWMSPLAVVKSPETCVSCGACYRACGFGVAEPFLSSSSGRLASTDCTACGDCADVCRQPGALAVECFARRLYGRKGSVDRAGTEGGHEGQERPPALRARFPLAGSPLVVGRREFVGSLAIGGLALAGYAVGIRKPDEPVLRMPGAQDESLFLARCNRCEACVAACPADCLRPMGIESGLRKLWTPRFEPREAGCIFEQCNLACARVCPTGAIEPVDPSEVRIGLAHVERKRCLAWRGKPCLVCAERCRFNAVDMTPRGPTVIADACTGCGACEETCPTPTTSIRVLPSG